MTVYALELPLIKGGEDIVELILTALKREGLELRDGDVLAIADKVVSTAFKRLINYLEVKPSEEALKLSKKYELEPGFMELILREADKVYGGVYRAVLTLKNGVLIANAGLDRKNAPEGYVVKWPEDPDREAYEIRMRIYERTGKRVGVILVDSRVNPMRAGTVGIAIGSSGIKPVVNLVGKLDLYGKPLKITKMNVVDDLASTAHLLMGETVEKRPLVLIRNAPIEISDRGDTSVIKMSEDECIYMKGLRK